MTIANLDSVALEQYRPTHQMSDSLWDCLKIPSGGVALHHALKTGFPFATLERLAKTTGFTQQDLRGILGMPRSTLQRREQAGRFTQTESDRLYRFAEIYEAALSLWQGDRQATHHWLTIQIKALGFQRPVDLLQTMAGTQQVLDVIGRLRYGVVT
nr:antitoxin Xre-like helix-turn-helix domain-containing protein [uncultured Halomonas sp.]